MSNRIAVVFGATGLVGGYLVEELIQNMGYSGIKVFTRRKLNIEHIKIIEHIVDIENVDSYKDMLRGDDLYICLGTTMRKVGSVKRYEELDRDMPVNISIAAREQGIKNIAVVSALGANAKSRSYYNRIKGEMEQGIEDIGFDTTIFVRPSLLLGKREEFRLFEKIASLFARTFAFILSGKLRIYRAIHGRDVSIAMISLLSTHSGKRIVLSHELSALADEKKRAINETNK